MDRAGIRTGDAGRDRAAFRARRAGIDRHRFPAPCAAEAVAAASAAALLAGTPGKGGGQHPAWHPGSHRGKGTKRLAEMKLLTLAEAGGVILETASSPRKRGPVAFVRKTLDSRLRANGNTGWRGAGKLPCSGTVLEYLSDSVGNVRIAACFPAYAKTSRSYSSA